MKAIIKMKVIRWDVEKLYGCETHVCLSEDVEKLEEYAESLKRCGNCEQLGWQSGDGGSVYHMCALMWNDTPVDRRKDIEPNLKACENWELVK